MATDTIADRLRSALPQESADRVFQEIDVARARGLPSGALEHRALALAAKGVEPSAIVREVVGYHRALWVGREALRACGHPEPAPGEVEAAGAALEKGMDDVGLSIVVRSVPADRKLTVPLSVVSSLLERGLPPANVIAAMQVWLAAHASDDELRELAGPVRGPGLALIRTGTPRTR